MKKIIPFIFTVFIIVFLPHPNSAIVSDKMQIDKFILVDAETNEELFVVNDSTIINFNNLPSKNINLEVTTKPNVVGSVKFIINSKVEKISNSKPYQLFDIMNNSDYNFITRNGSYTISAIPYNNQNAKGEIGEEFTLIFNVNNTDFSSTFEINQEVATIDNFENIDNQNSFLSTTPKSTNNLFKKSTNFNNTTSNNLNNLKKPSTILNNDVNPPNKSAAQSTITSNIPKSNTLLSENTTNNSANNITISPPKEPINYKIDVPYVNNDNFMTRGLAIALGSEAGDHGWFPGKYKSTPNEKDSLAKGLPTAIEVYVKNIVGLTTSPYVSTGTNFDNKYSTEEYILAKGLSCILYHPYYNSDSLNDSQYQSWHNSNIILIKKFGGIPEDVKDIMIIRAFGLKTMEISVNGAKETYNDGLMEPIDMRLNIKPIS